MIEGSADLDSVSAVRKAQEAGYEIISSGPDAIINCFDKLSKGARGPAAAFGVMLARFKDLYAAEPSFKPFTDLLRKFIAQRWLSRKARVLLGESVAASGHASSRDVARSIRRHPSYVRNANEALHQENSADMRRAGQWLSGAEIEAVLDEARGLVSGKEMMALLGVGKHEWDALRAGEFIKPRLDSDKMRKIWHPDDAAALLEKLKGLKPTPWDASPHWRRIAPGAAAAKLPYGLVVKAVLAGKIATSVDESKTGLRGIYVRRQSLAQLFAVLSRSPTEGEHPNLDW